MRKQVVVNHTIRIASALALLVSVMISPIRPHVTSRVTHSNDLRCNSGVPGKAPASQRPNIPISRVVQVKAVSTETKVDCLRLTCSRRLDLPYLAALAVESRRNSPAFQLDRTSYAPRC